MLLLISGSQPVVVDVDVAEDEAEDEEKAVRELNQLNRSRTY